MDDDKNSRFIIQDLYGALASFAFAGYRSSIFLIIFSAIEIEFEIAASTPGHGLSNWASLRAARIVAAIKRTRLRPSSTPKAYHNVFALCSPCNIKVGLAVE